MDPAIIVACIAAVGAGYGVWMQERRLRNSDNKAANREQMRAGIDKSALVNREIAEQFERMGKDIEDLRKRVRHLEATERKMLTWMALNNLEWPPPGGVDAI